MKQGDLLALFREGLEPVQQAPGAWPLHRPASQGVGRSPD